LVLIDTQTEFNKMGLFNL